MKKSILLCLITAWAATTNAQTYQWANSIGGTGNEEGQSIATDSSGNIYITGWFEGTVDFDPGGGTANLTSSGSKDIYFAKYDSSGNYIFAKKLGGSGENFGYGIGIDNLGNIIVAGHFKNTVDFDPGVGTANLSSAGFWDIFYAKYDSNGNYLWAKRIGSGSDEICYALAIDNSNNIYLTGYIYTATVDFDPGPGTAFLSTNGSADIFVAKYDSNGNYVYALNVGGTASDNGGKSIAVDASGNVYIVGNFYSTDADFDPGVGIVTLSANGTTDAFVAKYDATGNYVYAFSIGGGSYDDGHSIAVDNDGNAYITGYLSGTDSVDFDPGLGDHFLSGAGGTDIFVAKYSANGNLVFANLTGGGSNDFGSGLALDSFRNIYVIGHFRDTVDFNPGGGIKTLASFGSDNKEDVFITKYDSSGNYISAIRMGGDSVDLGEEIIIDNGLNIIALGTISGPGDFDPGPGVANLFSAGGSDVFISKYSQPCLYSGISYYQPSCNGASDGSVSTKPAGGTPPYTFQWSTSEITDSISGLSAGTYYVTVTDSTGCTATDSALITEPPFVATYTDTTAKILYDQRDCRQYPIEKIGNQWWMTENLDYLPSVIPPGNGSNTVPYYYVYGYTGTDVAAAKATSNYTTYGVLYNWTAAMNGAASSDSIPSGVQGVCPTGWHLPSDAEWKQLEMGLGMPQASADSSGWRGTDEGGKLKETGTTNWASPNTGATNSSGFTALPGGISWSGSFVIAGYFGFWWSASESGGNAWLRLLSRTEARVDRSTNK